MCRSWLLCFAMPCIIKPDMHHVCLRIMSCICCGVLVCWLLFSDCFFSIEFRKRSECEDSFDYVGSSSSWIRSSSKRDLRQDDHFPGYHYYHCHARCLVSIAVSLPTTCMSSLPNCHEKPLTSPHPSKTLFGYVTACSALLIALLVAGAMFPCANMDVFDISQYYCYLI
jgi:hypothetical protein